MTRRVSIPYKLTRIASFVLLVLSISCDISPPDIVILQPQAGKSYYGTLPCDLRVTDNKGVNKVEVFLDGRSVYLFTSAPYKADIEFSGYDGTTVEFKAVAQDDAGNFAEETRSVKLYQLPPPASPILSTPPNGSTISDDTPTFDWSDPTYAVGYELMVDNESSFTSPEIYETNLSSSTYTPSSGLSSDTYYWKVRAKNSAGVWGNWSPIWSFTIAGNIVVIEPTSSTVWDLGQQNVTISWDTGNLGGTVDIHLYKGSTQVRTIITGTSNDGSYTTWDLPTDLTPDTDYRVRVYQDASHYDYSEYFTIAGNIVVTEPTSSTVWDLGQQNVTISWYTGNLGGTVDIHLYKGTSQVETIATGTSNDGSHTTWDVPTSLTPDTDYRVRVHQDASHYDYSDYFTIAGNIVVTEPTSSTVWDLGQQNVTISWDTGNLGGTVDIHLYKGTSQVETIATGTSNDGSHTTWDVPTSLTPDTDYRVRVHQDASHYDFSEYFEIKERRWSDVFKLLAPDYYYGDRFGVSVAISGDYAIVGAYRESNDAGAAYVFRRTGLNTWDGGTKLVAPDAQDDDNFGRSVAISGDYAIVGAWMEDAGGTGAGAAYVFRRTGLNSWDTGVKLVASLAHSDEYFGVSVAISGDYAVVGANGDDTRGSDAGAAHVFGRTGLNNWDAGVELGASDAEAVDNFGESVAISGDYLVVGAHQEDTGGSDAGAAYVYHRTGTNSWDSGVKLMASDSWPGDRFGVSVGISGNYLVVGAHRQDTGGTDAGTAYIYHRTGTNSWDSGTKIVASDPQDGDNFGLSVAISGDYAIVGAWMEDSGGSDAGAAYVFRRTGLNSWDAVVKLVAPDAKNDDCFGVSVSIGGDYAIVGAYLQDGGSTDAGAAYIIK